MCKFLLRPGDSNLVLSKEDLLTFLVSLGRHVMLLMFRLGSLESDRCFNSIFAYMWLLLARCFGVAV